MNKKKQGDKAFKKPKAKPKKKKPSGPAAIPVIQNIARRIMAAQVGRGNISQKRITEWLSDQKKA